MDLKTKSRKTKLFFSDEDGSPEKKLKVGPKNFDLHAEIEAQKLREKYGLSPIKKSSMSSLKSIEPVASKSGGGKFQFKVPKAATILNGSFEDTNLSVQAPLDDSGYIQETEPFGRPEKVESPKKTVQKPKFQIDATISDDIESVLNNEAFRTNDISESTTKGKE